MIGTLSRAGSPSPSQGWRDRLYSASLPILTAFLVGQALPCAAQTVAAATTCGTLPPAPGADLPSTVSALGLIREWVDAINTADDAGFVRFVRDRGPQLRGAPADWLETRNALRDIRICGLKSARTEGMQVWMFSPDMDSYSIFHFKLSATGAEKPDLIWMQDLEEVPAGFAQPPRLAVPELIKSIDARATEQAAKDQFSGAVLIAQHGRVVFEKAYGLADRTGGGKPNTLDTQFRFGSMGKMFTAVAIMQLVQVGKINVAAPIGRYLPGYPNQDIATKVTVANLLTHTGGTGEIFGPESAANRASLRTPAHYVALFGSRAPEFAPGSEFSYSNYGFMLLGRIVETVSGFSYDDYIQRHILGPAGMTSTGNRPESDVLPRRAVSYTGYGAKLRSAVDTLPYSGTPAGGGYATVGDFNRFIDGLTSHKLLRADTLQKLIEGGVTMSDGKFADYDFGGSMPRNGRFIGHGGAHHGISGSLHHFIKHGFTVIVLANRDPAAAESISLYAAHRLPSE